MDYAEVLVHVFLPEVRNYYNLETFGQTPNLPKYPT